MKDQRVGNSRTWYGFALGAVLCIGQPMSVQATEQIASTGVEQDSSHSGGLTTEYAGDPKKSIPSEPLSTRASSPECDGKPRAAGSVRALLSRLTGTGSTSRGVQCLIPSPTTTEEAFESSGRK